MPRRARLSLLLAGSLIGLGTVAVAAGARELDRELHIPQPPRAVSPHLYVDPNGAAAVAVRALERAGRRGEAALIRRIADQPTSVWFTDGAPGYVERARRLVAAATAARRTPVLTLYNIPHRDCSGHSAGGASDAAAYRGWVNALAGALRGHRAIVVLEPDAVAQAVRGCLSAERAAERFGLLRHAVAALRMASPGVRVYVDAGNPTWVPAAQLGPALRSAGVGTAAGFALNVANFETTADNVAYGNTVSRSLGGKHFIVDTSRNGNGPAQRGAGDRHWCNPAGRRLGPAPTLRTGHALVDAYLWVKRPGESDGACGPGHPPAGHWFPAYALALAK
ncbi:glycoside hydrolase family 6 protein [Paractinoplanes brasiliensis]|uniref:Glucanase n=1 Tax=Paractinoplanes brasiliensis TaxID=52695 RepID=A0A4R6JQA2_9ACTN|nr:glycoside hydrolase family 6 protein [Actinoplanes brasiliensis]TDO38660.1 endoglucanase [Actinoplanes brasiliensis]GID26562.1 glucanase [Actinoplanes brasiliensis]